MPEVESSERAELAKVLRRAEPGKGMIGTVSVDGVDTGILLTYQLGTALDVEKIEAAVARQGIKGKSIQFRFYGTLPLKENSKIGFLLSPGKNQNAGETKLLLNQREILSTRRSFNDNFRRGVYLFLWVSTAGKMNDDALHVTRSGEQVDMVYTKQMLATLKASRAKALVDVSGITRKEGIEALKRIGATFNKDYMESGVRNVYLNGTAITDDQLKLVGVFRGLRDLEIKNCPNLTGVGLRHLTHLDVITLNMSNTAIGDEGLKHLNGKINLWQLNLTGTKVTGEGLKYLYKSLSLRKLWLPSSRSQISDESIEALQRALPKCKIYR